MKGTKAFELIIDTDKPSKACGIVDAGIQEQILRIAKSVGLHVSPVDKRASLNLTLGLTTITKHGIFTSNLAEGQPSNGGICVTGVRLTAFVPPRVLIEATGHKSEALTVLWAKEVLEAGNMVGHKFRVEKAARDLAKHFAMDWALDNKP